jgi:hypothetical protein
VDIRVQAGGIDALNRFFGSMPADSGVAFVVVLHLDPRHHSELASLLGHRTAMPVADIVDGTRIEPNRVKQKCRSREGHDTIFIATSDKTYPLVMIASYKSLILRDLQLPLLLQFTQIEHLAAFRDIREQHIHEGVLSVERRTSLIFRRNDSLNCSEVALTERVVLRTKETFTPSIGLLGIDPIVHDTPTYERPYHLRPVPSVKQQSIAVVRSVVDDEICESHWPVPLCCAHVL